MYAVYDLTVWMFHIKVDKHPVLKTIQENSWKFSINEIKLLTVLSGMHKG